MLKINILNLTGKVVGEQSLSEVVFDVKLNKDLIAQAVRVQRANARQVLAHTKTKAEVRGGGKKPWKQKGTGRARAGSIRSPLWRGGGVIFGPRSNRNFSLNFSKAMRNKAIRMILSDKFKTDHLIVVDEFSTATKTKDLVKALGTLPSGKKKTLLSLAKKNDTVFRSAANIAYVNVIAANSLNVVDMLKSDYLVVDKAAVETIEKTFNKK